MSLADLIANYLQRALEKEADSGVLEIQRNDLSERFGCSPSQINYVLETRFSADRGYLIESRRGGGGYVRILKLRCSSTEELIRQVLREIGDWISQDRAINLVKRLQDEELLSPREVKLLEAATDRRTLYVQLPERDILRARVLKAMLVACLTSGAVPRKRRQSGAGIDGTGN